MKWLKEDNYSLPVALAVGLHVGIVLTGVVAVDFSDTETPQPKRPIIVNATAIDIADTIIGKREAQDRAANQQAAIAAEKRKKEAEQKKQKTAERKALEERRKQLAQAKQLKEKAVAESAKKESERKQAAETKRLEQENEKKRLAQEVEKKRQDKQAEDERKRKEQELIRQAEAERLANKEKQRQAEAVRLAEEKKQAEEAAAKAAAAEKEQQRAVEEAQMVQSISSLINSRVTAVWNRPPSARNGMKAQLRIYFLPNGEVRDAQVTKGSGDALFDQRAVDAVYKVGRIEELADVDSYTFERNFRQIDLIFNPQDLRN